MMPRNSRFGFSSAELSRYSRHIALAQVGEAGQRKLKTSSALVVGAGGLGSPAALYLAAAGVGRIGVVDQDAVDLSNLQRQVLYSAASVGRPKAEAARERLLGLNPEIEVSAFGSPLDADNALDILKDFDVVIDGTDNLPARYLINDACALLNKPDVHGSVFRFEGLVSIFWAGRGPCYRCLHPEPPPRGSVGSCAEEGVLGVLPGIIGALQAAEAVKLILGAGEPLIGRVALFDALAGRWREIGLSKDPDCRLCGRAPSIRSLSTSDFRCRKPAQEAPMSANQSIPEISVEQLKAKLDKKEDFILLDVREKEEFAACRIPGSKLIPMGELPGRLGELDRSKEIVVHCKAGGRSARMVRFLLDKGFPKAFNVAGGITAWSERIDPSVPTY